MKKIFFASLLICVVTALPSLAQTADEAHQIQVLQSNAASADKEDACRRLKQIGTSKSVPALVALLTDEHLYQASCDALQTMPGDEAPRALCAALKTATGKPKAGIIHTLGERRYLPAAADLTLLLNDHDSLIATASARALGRIGSDESIRSLQKSLESATEPMRSACVDALLDCASQLVASGKSEQARAVYQQFDGTKEKENVRIAAYVGLIRSDENQALALVISGLAGADVAYQSAALRVAVEIRDSKATAAFTDLLAKSLPPLQIALLRLLSQRGDAAAAPAVLVMAQNPNADVRLAAIVALGILGDASMVPWLAQAATSSDKSEQKAARQALTELRHGDVAGAIIAQLPSASSGVQLELIRALTARRDKSAAPQLLALARTENAAVRSAALSALKPLVDGSHLPALVKLMEQSPDDASRAESQDVFQSLANRTSAGQKLDVTPLFQELNTTNIATRIALLQVSAFFVDDRLRAALRAALKDPNDSVRSAVARAVCDSRDAQWMPDLLELAKASIEPATRANALAGYVRLVGEDDANFPAPRRAQLLQSAFGLATRAEEKRLILSSLASAPNIESLQFVDRALSEPELKTAAEVAALRIATAMLPTEPTAGTTLLRRLVAEGSSPDVKTGAQSALKQFDADWLYTGPYRQAGVECRALFDVTFAPELPDSNQLEWRRASGTADLARRGEVDLADVVGGNDCVVYLKTRVFAPTAQPVSFAIGSDDGIKFWVNGELVHANNAVRGLTSGEDKANGKLRAGWNDLLAKVTQSSAGCGMTLEIKHADGSEIAGLRFDPHGGMNTETTGFKKLQLSDQFYAEGAYYGDFNRDGKLDIVAGPFWFEGPDFNIKHEYRPAKNFDPHGYSDNFLTYVADFNGDGWPDIFCVPFPGAEGYWYENPHGRNEPWQKHFALPMVGNESPGWVDVDGDGRPDLIFNNDGYLGYATWDPAQAGEPWKFHAVSRQDNRFQRFTHGIGAGDINGDGRVDLVEATGWWEHPANPSDEWKFHPQKFAEAGSQMLVYDVDGDGLADVITAWHCHLYGLVWWRQLRDASGEIQWEQNIILPPAPDLKLDALRISELHSMDLVDMNGDGLKDIVTGKRFWAHGPAGDMEPDAPAVLYWFELKRANGKATFVPHFIDDHSGVGTQVTAVDLNGDGRPDIIVANKQGIFVHLSEGQR
jgi:HEAT repeat protein